MSALSFGPQRAVKTARSGLGRAQDRIADRLAAAIQIAPGPGVETLMRSPARGPVVAAIFSQMPRRINRTRAAGLDAVVRWRVTHPGGATPDTFDLVFAAGSASVRRATAVAKAPSPRLTVTMTGAELLRLATGGSDAMDAFFRGRVELTGDLILAARLTTLFRLPAAAR
jgi:putative sterol carrier protein